MVGILVVIVGVGKRGLIDMMTTKQILILFGVALWIFTGLVIWTVSEHIDNTETEDSNTEFRCNLWNGTLNSIEYNVTYDNFTRHDNKEFESNERAELNRFDLSLIEYEVLDRSFKDKIERYTNDSVHVFFNSYEYNDSLNFELTVTYYESIYAFNPFYITELLFESDECLEYIKIYKVID